MRRPDDPGSGNPGVRLSTLIEKSREMPDQLVAILLDLQLLCESEMGDLSPEVRQRIGDACEALKLAVGNSAAIAGYVNRLSGRADTAVEPRASAVKNSDASKPSADGQGAE